VAPIAARRRAPFSLAAAIVVVVSIAVARLPDTLMDVVQRHSVLNGGAAGWALRLLALAAAAQATYGAFGIFRPERVETAMRLQEDVAALSSQELVSTLSRTAALMVVLTVVYGLALVSLTGERGGFWLFVLLAGGQGAWYYRECGRIAAWLDLRVGPASISRLEGAGMVEATADGRDGNESEGAGRDEF
jgi:hypothetical protein